VVVRSFLHFFHFVTTVKEKQKWPDDHHDDKNFKTSLNN